MEAVIIASGPSAQNAVVPDGALLIAVNGSHAICPRRPDVLVIGEKGAAATNADAASGLHAKGTRILGRPFVKIPGREVINDQLGPPHLHHLHSDVLGPIPRGSHGLPFNSRVWMTSGVLALWWALDQVQPERVTVYGIDGYPAPNWPPRHQHAEYADGVVVCERRPERSPEWVEQNNWYQGMCLWALSNWYTDSKIVMASRHQFHNPRWRVKIMEAAQCH